MVRHFPQSNVSGCRSFRTSVKVTRRSVLQAGSLGMLGLGLGDLLGLRTANASGEIAPGPKAKACIFLFMWGGPSHLDTFDLKPEAPDEVRGDFKPIATAVPGTNICEHFSRTASLTDRLSIIRSLHHSDPAHLSSAHATLTGHWAPVIKSDAEPPSRKDSPQIGSIVARHANPNGSLPPSVTLPWVVSHPAAPGGQAPGQNGGWLGKSYDPFVLSGDPNNKDWQVKELSLQSGLSIDRLQGRQRLLANIDEQRAALEQTAKAGELDVLQQKAFSLLASPQARSAFDLKAEPDSVRDRYGRNIHGQCVLMARRLVEHGVPLVTVNWHNDGRNFWDTHGNNFNRLKDDLIPPADQALSALIEDLEQRGLLDETLIVWVGEFGRKPIISKNNAGREHWPFCYSGLLAGGGIRGGSVYGASDAHGSHPALNAVTPLDFAATIYEALGINPHQTTPDPLGRPIPISGGNSISELFG